MNAILGSSELRYKYENIKLMIALILVVSVVYVPLKSKQCKRAFCKIDYGSKINPEENDRRNKRN